MYNPTVFIVDDDSANIQVLAEALDCDYNVIIATNGMQAIRLAQQTPPDLIILDIGLPDITGYEVLKYVKKFHNTRNIPVLLLTSLIGDKDELKGLSMGAVDYIRKPATTCLIQARVKNHVEMKVKNDRLERLAMIDELTGIANRRRFEEEYTRAWSISQRSHRELAIAILDVDHFKLYNDFYGHSKGDDCLQLVAQTIQDSLQRPLDFVARYGGEEFVVILPDINSESAIIISEKIRKNIEQLGIKHEHPEVKGYLTVSIGVACIQPDSKTVNRSLIEEADRNLYKAKKMGRNCLVRAAG